MISVIQLGVVDYATGLRLQQRLVELRKQGFIGDVLLLLEHSPVITLGRNAKAANVLVSAEQLARRGVEVFECDRGGDVTFHGPGQLVAYPVFDLHGFPSLESNRKTLGAVEFVRRLEEVLICTCTDFGISTERVPGLTGVWTRQKGDAAQAKIAAIGVHISRGVTSHGFALNVNTDLSFFNLIVPCGVTSKPVTSMEQELGKQLPVTEIASVVAGKFVQVFRSEISWVASLDGLFGGVLDMPVKPPSELRQLHREEETFWA